MRLSILLLALLFGAPAVAAPDLSDAEVLVADIALADVAALPRADAVELAPSRVLRWGGGTFVHLDQRWDGLSIHGARVIVDYDGRGALRAIHGQPLRSLPLGQQPAVDVHDAVRTAEAFVAGELGDGALWPPRVEPGLLRGKARTDLAWVVDLSTAEPVGAWRVFVDALDGRILSVRQRAFTAQGNVYPTNPTASELTEVELPIDGDELSNEYAYVNSCSDFDDQHWTCNAKEVQATPNQGGDFLFDPDPMAAEDPFAEVQMLWHLDRIARWFDQEFGFRVDFGLGGNAVEGIVNFDLANAFFGDADGDGIPEVAFGQGYGVDFAYDADVIYHEFGHAMFGQVVEDNTGRYDEYGRLVAPAGLNEGTADLFSLVLTGDPMLGEYAGGGLLGGGAIRELDDDRHCPTDIYGESHVDGEIWGAFGWNVIEDELLGPDVAANLVFGALNEWTDEVTFGMAGQSLVHSADALLEEGYVDDGQHAALLGHIEAAGLDDCGRVIRLDEGQEPTQYMTGRIGNDGTPRLRPLPNQFSLDAPEGAVALRFYVEELVGDEGLGFTVFVRRGEHIIHELVESGGWGGYTAVADVYDFSLEDFETGLAVELTLDSDPALEPGATYYFSITSAVSEEADGRVSGDITLWGEADIVPPEEEPDEGEDEGAGCQDCGSRVAAEGAPTAAWSVLGLGMVLGLIRRRS